MERTKMSKTGDDRERWGTNEQQSETSQAHCMGSAISWNKSSTSMHIVAACIPRCARGSSILAGDIRKTETTETDGHSVSHKLQETATKR